MINCEIKNEENFNIRKDWTLLLILLVKLVTMIWLEFDDVIVISLSAEPVPTLLSQGSDVYSNFHEAIDGQSGVLWGPVIASNGHVKVPIVLPITITMDKTK